MSILSLEFLALAAGVMLVYYLLPLNIRWIALLCGSAAFVALSGWQSAAHLSAVALIMWGGGLLLQKKKSRLLLALFLILDLGAMAFLKYYPALSGAQWILPLGFSYFTFQSAGYLVDVCRGKAEAQKNPLKAWLFVGYFPQLSQGPISTWKELGGQLMTGHRFEPDAFVSGFQLLLWGFFKKMVITDRLAATTDALLKGGDLPGWFILGGVILYAVRLYADFPGGMDVIRGVSRMLGIELPENFRRPFFSQSVSEYWRRWHITLGAWFRSYLLYPLTTSKAGIALGKAASKAFG
ncbi:MAG: MBOAT family protein [Clostridia bacterium]|nr:MBOAT family protein [Clostridia bacterium]